MKTTAEKIAVMQAYERGETIEQKFLTNDKSLYLKGYPPTWDWEHWDYRIAHKPRELIVKKHSNYITYTWTSETPLPEGEFKMREVIE